MTCRLTLGLLATITLASAPARAVDPDLIDRAVDKGVKALRQMQQADGTWPHQHIGATALAGLTLLECGAKEDDKNVLLAADAVRRASITLTHTYSISLSLLFLDRLHDPEDVPLIESLMVRLLAGQNASTGGWSYECPSISEAEKLRLLGKLTRRKGPTRRRNAPKEMIKRTYDDLSPEIREQLRALERGEGAVPGFAPFQPGAPGGLAMMGGVTDNSNTQFAALGLWVGRRHGIPIEKASTRLARRFRTTQMADGGWTYMGELPGAPGNAPFLPGMGSTPAMTCAGLIALAIADGASLEHSSQRKEDAKLPEDEHLKKGLEALGAVIDNPRGLRPGSPFVPAVAPFAPVGAVGGRSYYFLWSLERVAMALDLKTIGNKDWYGWGAEILLINQNPDGTWSGDYASGGVDTCFALLFLRRANLVSDLTVSLKGKVVDPGERVLSGGGGKLRGRTKMLPGIENKDARPMEKPLLKAASLEGGRLAEALVKATGPRRDQLLETMESEKGVQYTEALAAAIPKLEGKAHSKARQALANRLTRMKDETLEEYLCDEDAEIRRAAAIAVGQKDSKALVPNLISLLADPEISVVRAAHASLKALTEQDFGPAATATREERDQALRQWIAWWNKHRKKN